MPQGRVCRVLLGIAGLLVSMSAVCGSNAAAKKASAKTAQQAVENIQLPVLFERNAGQADPTVRYLARARGYTVLLKQTGPELLVGDGQTPLSLKFRGSSAADLQATDPNVATVNYYRGQQPANWQTNISTYERVAYQHLYPGIDLQFYGNQRRLEHDFVVAPGARPEQIAFTVGGVLSQRTGPDGDLLLKLADGELRLKRPVAYQDWAGRRRPVTSSFEVAADGTVHFKVGRYDRRHVLVIDPVLTFSTYLGGNGGDSLRGVTVFPGSVGPGAVYVVGVTNSTNLPATVGQTSLKGVVNGYVAKFNISTNALVWLTYFGGSHLDYINGVTNDAGGNVYIGGDTTSPDLPLAGNSVDTSLNGPKDGFVAEFNTNGTLVYSTYLGGSRADRVLAVAVDSSGHIDVTGDTFSPDFPAVNAIQAFQGDGSSSDIFITQIDTSTTSLPFSTPFGGTSSESGRAIAVDANGDIAVGGETYSTDFPASGMDPVYGTVSAFVLSVVPSESVLLFSDVFGGSSESHVTGIAVDGTGIYVTGNTDSVDFPITSDNRFQGNLAGGFDAFVSKIDLSGNSFIYSSYLGGSGNDNNDSNTFQGAIAVSSGIAYVTGYTDSADFPVVNPTQGYLQGVRNAFVSKVNGNGSTLTFSTFLGGSTVSQAYGIAVNPSTSNIYVVGDTTDSDFPLVNPVQGSNAGGADGFVSVYQQPTSISDVSVTVTPSTQSPQTGTSFNYTVSVVDNGPDPGVNNVVMYNTLPANVSLVSVFSFQGSCTSVGQLITCNLGHMTQGNIVIVSITVVPTSTTGSLTDVATVRSDDDDSDLSNNRSVSTLLATYGSCYDPSLGTKGWKGGSDSGATNYNDDSNWDPFGVPTSEDSIVVCGDAPWQPVMSQDNTVSAISVKEVGVLDLGLHNLITTGDVHSLGLITDGTVTMTGQPAHLQGYVPNLIITGNTYLTSTMAATGDVVVAGGGSFAPSGFAAGIGGQFRTTGGGTLVMQNAQDIMTVSGDIIFSGGPETALLTNGLLATSGNFSALDNGVLDNFHANSPHRVFFVGNSPSVSLAHSGQGQQFGDLQVLYNLTLASPVVVSGAFDMVNATQMTVSGGFPLSAGGAFVNGATFSNVPLSLGNGEITEFDNVIFTNMDPSAVQFSITHDGSQTPYTFNGLQFLTTPTSGKYISASNTNPSLGQLVIDLVSSTPSNGYAYTQVDSHSTVNWPSNSGVDVSVSVTPNPLSAFVGQTINYVVNVTNAGTANATGVTAVMRYTGFNGSINVTGANCTSSDTITCDIGNLAVGQSVPINLAVVSDDAKVIQVSSSVTLNESDINLQNNTASASATFNPVGNPPPGTVNGTVVYSRTDDGSGTVWAAAGDGSSDQEVTIGSWPRVSPDQQFIVFHRDNNAPDRANMYLFDVQAQTDSLIYTNNDFQNGYTFTSDSSQIYFDYSCGEYKMNRDGSNVTTVFQSDCYDDNPRFNPAGTQLAFENAHFGVGVFNPDGSGRTFIPNTQPGDFMPAWSPDGTRIAFVRYQSGGAGNLFVINPDGTNLLRLSFLTVAGDGPTYGSIAWTPDGTKIVFAGLINGVAGLYTVSTDGNGTMSQLSISNGGAPGWVGDVIPNTSVTADLGITSSVPASVTVGNTLPLTLTVRNLGPSDASGIQVVTTLPSGTSFISGSSDQSQPYVVNCSAVSATVTCNVVSVLPANQSLTILIDATVQGSGNLSFNSNVTSATTDPNRENNSSSSSTQVGAPACVQPPSGMVSWYRAEINGYDQTGAHDGTLVNSPQFVSGKVGDAFSLDGTKSYLNLATVSGQWSLGGEWSVEAWVNPNTTDSARHIVAGALDVCDDWGIVYQNGQFGAVIPPVSGCTGTVFSDHPADLNQYSHVVATSDGTVAKIYVNGQLLNSAPVAPNHTGFTIPMIGQDNCCNELFSGNVDEVTFYNRALSDTEIGALFNAGSAGKCATQDGSSADVALSAASSPTIVNGHPTYSVTVTNNGPQVATGVVFTDALDNFQYVSYSSTQGTCFFNSGTLSCGIGSLAVNASATIAISVIPPNQGWAAHNFHAAADQSDPNPVNNDARVGPPDTSFNTSEGSDVTVQTSDNSGDAAQVTFASVTRKGTTSIQGITSIAPPSGFRHGTPPAVFDVSTTATTGGSVQLAVAFNPAAFHHPGTVRLFHLENGVWVDRTRGVDLAGKRVAGTTSSLSPFALFEPLDKAPVANSGGDRTASGNVSAGSTVFLTAAGSSDADGDALTYRWTGPFPEGGGTVTGATPTVTLPFGNTKVTLVVNDGEVDSVPSVANINVTDFKVSASAMNGVMTSGQPATYAVDVAPQFGSFDTPIALACKGLPSGLTCSFGSATVTPGANASSVTLTIAKATISSRLSQHPFLALWLGLPFGIVVLGSRNARRRGVWLLVIALTLAIVMMACGGGGGSSGFSSQTSSSPSSSVVTITGTSGALTRTTTVQLTVNP